MNLSLSPVPDASDIAAKGARSGQFDLLAVERQDTIEGRSEPLLAVDAFHARADAAESKDAYAAQAELFGWPQAELPFHPKIDGQVNPDCLKGWRAKADSHAKNSQVHAAPECCGVQRCESSKEGNDSERARDVWNGSKPKKKGGTQYGWRHVLGSAALAQVGSLKAAALGVLVVTLPPHLRPSKVDAKKKLKRLEREAYAALCRVLQGHIARAGAQFYVRAHIHPCGEDSTQWKPHLNFTVACWSVDANGENAKRFNPYLDLTENGPLKTAMREVQARVFGDGENAQCFWKYEQKDLGKRHQASYVPRTFPQWAHLGLRPASYGLAHAKNRPVLVNALADLRMKPLPPWVTVELREGFTEPAPVSGYGATQEQAHQDCLRQLEAHRRSCAECRAAGLSSYPEHRRTMTAWGSPGPPEHGPPDPEPPDLMSRQRIWARFQSLQA